MNEVATVSSTPPTEDARTRRRRRAAREIQAAALDLFERRGFDATSTDEIAAAADISPRTFFRYFPTKESVVFWDDYAPITEELLSTDQLDGSSPPAFVRAGILAAFALVLPDDEDLVARRTRVVFATPALLGHLAADMAAERARLAAGVASRFPELSPLAAEAVAGAAVGATVVALERWAAGGGDLMAMLAEALDAAGLASS